MTPGQKLCAGKHWSHACLQCHFMLLAIVTPNVMLNEVRTVVVPGSITTPSAYVLFSSHVSSMVTILMWLALQQPTHNTPQNLRTAALS